MKPTDDRREGRANMLSLQSFIQVNINISSTMLANRYLDIFPHFGLKNLRLSALLPRVGKPVYNCCLLLDWAVEW